MSAFEHLSLSIDEETKGYLARIANALEKIAATLGVPEPDNDGPMDFLSNDVFEEEEVILENDDEQALSAKEEMTAFLVSRGIEIKVVPPETPADSVINSLSMFLGERYQALAPLLSHIKRNMQQGRAFSLSIKGYTQQAVSDVCQFCSRLHTLAFLEEYKYFNSPRFLIHATPSTLPSAQNFFSGQWLERYVLQTVQEIINSLRFQIDHRLHFAYLLNPQIVLPNGNDFELDLIFYLEGQVYWLEAKTGKYQQHIAKYSKISKILNLDESHALMVLTDISDDQTAALSSLFSMQVCNLGQLRNQLAEIITNDLTNNGLLPEGKDTDAPSSSNL